MAKSKPNPPAGKRGRSTGHSPENALISTGVGGTAKRTAEAELALSERLYRAIGESIDYGVWVCAPDGRNTYASPSFLKMVGLTQQQCSDFGWGDVLHPDDAERTIAAWKECVRTGGIWDIEHRFRGVDGQYHDVLARGVPVKDEKGNVLCWAGINLDISKLKQAEGELRHQAALVRAISDNSPDPIFLKDRQSRVLLANPAILALLGKPADQVIGRTDEELYEDAAIGRAIMANDRQVMESGEAAVVEEVVPGLRGLRVFLSTKAPYRDGAGRVVGLVGVARDITERKKEEAELKGLNRTLKALGDGTQALVHAEDEIGYLNEVCRIIVEDCGHAMVWIGFAEQDAARTIRPVAFAGFEEGYLESLKLSWADSERGRGPTGTAIRTGKPCMCRNMVTDPAFAPWRAEALKRGYASSIVLPLLSEGKAFGAISIYSRETNAFSEDETRLLAQLADDVSYCIGSLRLRAAKAQAELEREKFVSLANNSTEFIGMCDLNFIPFYVNAAGLLLVGLDSLEQAVRTPVKEFFFPEDQPLIFERLFPRVLQEGRAELEVRFRHFKTGEAIWVIYNVFQIRDAEGRATGYATVSQDITMRKRAERRTELLAETAARLLGTDSPQQVVDELCHKVLDFLDCQAFFNYIVDETQGRLHLGAWAGIPEPEARKIEWLDLGAAVCGCAARDACRVVVRDIQRNPNPRTDLVRSHGIQAYACHPIIAAGRVLGTLSFGTRNRIEFSEDDLALMKAVADLVAMAMERQHTREALRSANEELERRVAKRTAALHAAERYARSLLEASLDPLVTISHDGKITDVNLATELVTGVPRRRLIGSSFPSYFTEPELAEAGYQKVLKEGAVSDYPLTIRHASRHTTDVLYNAAVYRNEAGQVQGVFAAARDITERKSAERRRDFTNALLQLFAQKVSARDYLSSVVEAVRQWTGCQALGIRVVREDREIPYESWAGFDPAFIERENHLSLERERCCCIRAITQQFEEADRALLTAGGSYRIDDAISLFRGMPPRNQECFRGACPSCGFASLAIIPIRYREETIGAIHLADRRPGRFPRESIEFLESMAPLIGEALRRFQTEAELARHRDHLGMLVQQRTGELQATNARLQTEAAERQRAQENLQQTAEELARSNRELERFAYIASHDLQEPLRAVGGYVQLLQRRFPDHIDAKAVGYIKGAAEGAARMERLITDLLAFSRVGTRAGAFALADLNAVLNEALHNLQTSIKNTHAKVTRDSLPTLPVDATQVMQLFQNLIGNAVKFRSERPLELHVGAKKEPGRWVFSVRDNGIGIEPQYFERIFEIFQRLHTRRRYPGTGIGLAICQKIVERHGGAIWVESAPGRGSTFFFSLPETSAIDQHAL